MKVMEAVSFESKENTPIVLLGNNPQKGMAGFLF